MMCVLVRPTGGNSLPLPAGVKADALTRCACTCPPGRSPSDDAGSHARAVGSIQSRRSSRNAVDLPSLSTAVGSRMSASGRGYRWRWALRLVLLVVFAVYLELSMLLSLPVECRACGPAAPAASPQLQKVAAAQSSTSNVAAGCCSDQRMAAILKGSMYHYKNTNLAVMRRCHLDAASSSVLRSAWGGLACG